MAMRRARIKPTLAIRRPAVKDPTGSSGAAAAADIKPILPVVAGITEQVSPVPEPSSVDCKTESGKNHSARERKLSFRELESPVPAVENVPEARPKGEVASSSANKDSAFKCPNPVVEPPRIVIPPPTALDSTPGDEPNSPKKMDTKFAYINALNSPRKRIRTESMTSNKSYSDVSLKSRKTIKQEESQRNSDAKRDLRKRLNNIQNIDKQTLTMFDMIYYNPAKNPMKSPAISKLGSLENIPQAVGSGRESRAVSKSRSPTPAPSMPPPPTPKAPVQLTPQLKLGPNGEMILDEASLVVENEREKEIRDALARTEVVYQDEFSGNSGYYSRYKRTRDWPPEETIRFYRCLHTIGTDFSMMNQLFPNRTRRDLKLKFKKEERLNLRLVNKALLFPKHFNIEELQEQFNQEDEEIERQKEAERQIKLETEEKLREQKLAKKLMVDHSKNRNPAKRVSKSERVMMDAESLMRDEPLMKEVKPKRRRKRRKGADEARRDVSSEQQSETAASQVVPGSPVVVPPAEEDNVFVEPENDDSSNSVEMSLQNQSRAPLDVSDAPYVPNGEMVESVGVSQSLQDSVLDIEMMDIHIVDNDAKSVYEIKAEPKVYPVQTFDTSNAVSSEPNYITLQNLDNKSQMPVSYQINSNDYVDNSIESLENKYYGGCDVYIPMPSNAPIARPVQNDEGSLPSSISLALQSPTKQNSSTYYKQESYVVVPPDSGSYSVPSTKIEQQEVYNTETPVYNYQIPEESESNQSLTVDRLYENFPSEPQVVVSKNEPDAIVEETALAATNSIIHQEAENVEQQYEENEEDEEEASGLGALENIDLNSLVLVESQDTNDPSRTIYEIYVTDPETGKLSEKPLDVPEDVIENVRSILEGGVDEEDE